MLLAEVKFFEKLLAEVKNFKKLLAEVKQEINIQKHRENSCLKIAAYLSYHLEFVISKNRRGDQCLKKCAALEAFGTFHQAQTS